jgi:hypothetical protein
MDVVLGVCVALVLAGPYAVGLMLDPTVVPRGYRWISVPGRVSGSGSAREEVGTSDAPLTDVPTSRRGEGP